MQAKRSKTCKSNYPRSEATRDLRLKFQERSELKLVSLISESQVSEAKRTEICWTNYPAAGGGYHKYPWHPANVVGRDVDWGSHTRDLKKLDFMIIIRKITCAN